MEGQKIMLVSLTRKDASNEDTVSSFNLPTLLADGTNYAALTALYTALETAIDDICAGVQKQRKVTALEQRLTNVVPTDDSRRENKWRVVYEAFDTKAVYDVTLGCADWTNCNRAGTTDWWDMTNLSTEQQAFIDAFEAAVVMPNNAAVTVLGVEDVGRNI
jgi:hypothetical protein